MRYPPRPLFSLKLPLHFLSRANVHLKPCPTHPLRTTRASKSHFCFPSASRNPSAAVTQTPPARQGCSVTRASLDERGGGGGSTDSAVEAARREQGDSGSATIGVLVGGLVGLAGAVRVAAGGGGRGRGRDGDLLGGRGRGRDSGRVVVGDKAANGQIGAAGRLADNGAQVDSVDKVA